VSQKKVSCISRQDKHVNDASRENIAMQSANEKIPDKCYAQYIQVVVDRQDIFSGTPDILVLEKAD